MTAPLSANLLFHVLNRIGAQRKPFGEESNAEWDALTPDERLDRIAEDNQRRMEGRASDGRRGDAEEYEGEGLDRGTDQRGFNERTE